MLVGQEKLRYGQDSHQMEGQECHMREGDKIVVVICILLKINMCAHVCLPFSMF